MTARAAISFIDSNGSVVTEKEGDVLVFSAYKCFYDKNKMERNGIFAALADFLISLGQGIVFVGINDFLVDFLNASPGLRGSIRFFIDKNFPGNVYEGFSVRKGFDHIPDDGVAFICETELYKIWAMEKELPPYTPCLSPQIVALFPDIIPEYAWIPKQQTIYPISLPKIEFQNNLDVLLLDLPSRFSVQYPVGFSYVIKALKRSSVSFQAFDCSIVNYHRFFIHKFHDLGHDPVLGNGRNILSSRYSYGDDMVLDPRYWPYLLEFFHEDYELILSEIVRVRPKILALSIHSRNEWFSRSIAVAVKSKLPETIILVGGHSCYTREMGMSAFPEYDYMIVGEADLVVGSLVEALARGERPVNLPGVVSVYDDPAIPFVPAPLVHNLDMLGGLDYDVFPNLNELYQTYIGERDTALPLTRGCVWSRCTFCAERFSFRSRSAVNYVDEIEYHLNSGRPGAIYSSDSDFGGNPYVIQQVCEEIIRRNLKVNITGQIRINKNYTREFFEILKESGISVMNFGVDALSDNTLKLQKKGYTVDTVLRNYQYCHDVGITTYTNIVVGIPGETDQDVEDVIDVVSRNRHLFPAITGMNVCDIFNNSPYWYDPEGHNIRFYGVKEDLYKEYPFGIPQSLWYSVEPFADKAIRLGRMRRLLDGLSAIEGVIVAYNCYYNYNNMCNGGGHVDFRSYNNIDAIRKISLQRASEVYRNTSMGKLGEPPQQYRNHLIALVGNGQALAIPYESSLFLAAEQQGIQVWHRT